MSFFEKIDLLSYQPKIYTSQSERHNTRMGGIVQLMLIVFYFAGIVYFSKDIYLRINPNVIGSQSKVIYKDSFRFQSKFSIYIAVMDNQLGIPFRNESIYSIKFYQNILDIEKGFISSPLESEVCSKESFEEKIPASILDAWNWGSYTCLKKGTNATLKGSDMDLSNWFLTAFIAPCDRTVPGHKCGTEAEINAKLIGANVQSFLIDKFLDPNNFTDPIQYYTKMIVTAASIGYKNLAWYHFKTINLIDDTGLLFQTQNTQSVIAFDEVTTSFGPSAPGDNNIFQFIYQQSTAVENVNRNYIKLQQVVASVGGLVAALNIICKFIVNFLSEKIYFRYLFDKFLAVKRDLDQNASGRKEDNSNVMINPQRIQISPRNASLTPVEVLKNKLKPLQTASPLVTNLSRQPPKLNKDLKKLGDSSSFFKTIMDYEYIVSKFKEIELVKLLILSENQNASFKNLVENKSFTHALGQVEEIADNYRAKESIQTNETLLRIQQYFA